MNIPATTVDALSPEGKGKAGKPCTIRLTEAQLLNGQRKVLEYMANHGLKPSGKVIYRGTQTRAKQKTLDQHLSRFESLKRFCYLIGDWRSAMIVSCDICPKNPFPMKPSTLKLYVSYHYQLKNVPLKDDDGNIVVF